MARNTKFNPDKFRSDVLQLNPHDAADVAVHWKTKATSIKNEMAESTQDTLEIGITGATAFGLSYLQGGWAHDQKAATEKWVAGGAAAKGFDATKTSPFVEGKEEDPTKFMSIDKTLWATIVLGAATVFKLGGKKYNSFLRASALGAMATWAGGLGHDIGYTGAAEAATAAAAAGTT
ncbi:unnamed protein product [marine sediment metagenome]|uniref:Uncharacterized protein n=1 Tax=marine sediment metagenome TaxID=412755 RepID=X0XFQ4_9ZZZZ